MWNISNPRQSIMPHGTARPKLNQPFLSPPYYDLLHPGLLERTGCGDPTDAAKINRATGSALRMEPAAAFSCDMPETNTWNVKTCENIDMKWPYQGRKILGRHGLSWSSIKPSSRSNIIKWLNTFANPDLCTHSFQLSSSALNQNRGSAQKAPLSARTPAPSPWPNHRNP